MNLSSIIICLVIGIIFGIIGGALWMVIKITLSQRKALRDFKKGNLLKLKEDKK